MSDESTNDGATEFTPITSQDALNAVVSDRVKRERAKFGDYNDLKAKAARLDEIEAANKSEAEKSAERIAGLERELAASQSATLRARVQARFKIADEDADLFLTASDEETLTRQAERLAGRSDDQKAKGPFVPTQANTPQKPADDGLREFAQDLFGTKN